jgi:hypothetical protein
MFNQSMRGVSMCKFPLCFHLKESLDAAFRGGVYEGEKAIQGWGRAVVDALYWDKCRHPHSLIWYIAQNNLLNIMMNCPCEGLAQVILSNPESFLRTTLILASRQVPGQKPGRPVVFH